MTYKELYELYEQLGRWNSEEAGPKGGEVATELRKTIHRQLVKRAKEPGRRCVACQRENTEMNPEIHNGCIPAGR